MLKPDAVQRGLVGEIVKRFERKGFKMIASKLVRADRSTLEEHYKGTVKNIKSTAVFQFIYV